MATPTIGGSPDPAQIANTTNSLIRDVQGMQDVQVFKDDTGTRRVLMGRGPSGFYGMKVSQEGNDVYDATDDQLVFNSDNNIFKIVQTGEITVTPPFTGSPPNTQSGTHTTSLAHGLSFTPAYIAYVTIPSTAGLSGGDLSQTPLIYPDDTGGASRGTIFVMCDLVVDSTNITAKVYQRNNIDYSPADPNFVFKYYLLQETAT